MFDAPDVNQTPHYEEVYLAKSVISGGTELFYKLNNELSQNMTLDKEDLKTLSIIRPKPKQNLSYKELVCDEKDKTTIATIISWMAEHGKLWLLAHKGELNRMGDDIDHVHPLKFLETIFSNSYLKDCMFEIWDDYFKRNGFMDGLRGSLDAKVATKELHKYLPEFSKAIKIHQDKLAPFLDNRSWDDFVYFLMVN